MEMKPIEIASKVIVVEDDPTLLCFWRRMLKDLGVTDAVFFSDPKEALVLIEEVPCKVLISDIVMPDINGYELARLAIRRSPLCSVILTTAYSADLSRFDLANCRFHLLHKPYTDIVEVRKFVRHVLEGDSSFNDISEDSFSENEDYPDVTEWKL